jgi:WD40 repeat protein
MSSESPQRSAEPDWIRGVQGNSPSLAWSFTTEGRLTGLALAREAAEVFATDESGILCRIDRRGKIAALNRLPDPVRLLDWSDDGRMGAAVCGEATLHLFNHVLQSQWSIDLPEPPLSVAIAPYGTHVAVGLADGTSRIYDSAKQKLAKFETIRPLAHLHFVATEAGLIGAAEHGLICRLALDGKVVWSDKLWSNVGQLSIAGDASMIYLACHTHGVQVYDGDGGTVGSYVLDGTVSRAAVSFEPQRILAATIERKLFWLDADGELLWSAEPPDAVETLAVDPLGEWAICGLKCGRIFRLDWTRGRQQKT